MKKGLAPYLVNFLEGYDNKHKENPTGSPPMGFQSQSRGLYPTRLLPCKVDVPWVGLGIGGGSFGGG